MAIVWPAFALVALTACVMLRLARLRFAAVAGGQAGVLLVSLAWAYVAFRVVHSTIHLSTNKVLWRFRAFAASWLVLIAYWVVLGIGFATAGSSPAAAG